MAHDLAAILVNEKPLADYFEEALKDCPKAPKALSNWIVVEFGGRYKEQGAVVWKSGIPPRHIGALVAMIEAGTITGKIAKKVADEMVAHPEKSPDHIVQSDPAYRPVEDEQAIRTIIEQVLAENQQSVLDYQSGKERAFGFLVGQVMKATQGKASPPLVNRLLKELMTN